MSGQVVSLELGADPALVARTLAAHGQWVRRLSEGDRGQPLLLLEPHSRQISDGELAGIPGVATVFRPTSPHPLVDAQPREVVIAGVPVGGTAPPVLVAGPCAVESAAQIDELAGRSAAMGARLLRGGAWKPRTSPYAFGGHGAEALGWLRLAGERHGLGVVTEAMSVEHVGLVAEVADLIQIGSRNMQNYPLLRAVGGAGKPVLLKRGAAATVEEWLLAAEHCLYHGAPSVIFCERGVRGFDPASRNLFDLGAVALLRHALGLLVMADPSHASGRRDLVVPLGKAALAAGAMGLLVEVHDHPELALSDGPQALDPSLLGEFGIGGRP